MLKKVLKTAHRQYSGGEMKSVIAYVMEGLIPEAEVLLSVSFFLRIQLFFNLTADGFII